MPGGRRSRFRKAPPESNGLIRRSGDDDLAVGRHAQMQHASAVSGQVGNATQRRVLPERQLVVAVTVGSDNFGSVAVPENAADLALRVDAVERIRLDDGKVRLDRRRVAAGEGGVDVRQVVLRVVVEVVGGRAVQQGDRSGDRSGDGGVDIPETERLVGGAAARREKASANRIPSEALDRGDVAAKLHQRPSVLDRG